MLRSLTFLALCCVLVAQAADDPRTAKLAELMRLQGLGRVVEQARAAHHEATVQAVRSMTDKTLAQYPHLSAEKRAAVEASSQKFVKEADNGFDPADAVQAWGRFYSQGLTDQDLDAILAYYRSPVGQKDVQASQAALPQFQKYIEEKRAATTNKVLADYTVELREIVNPARPVVAATSPSNLAPTSPLGANPTTPDGKVLTDSVSYSCEAPATSSPAVHGAHPSGRSVLCVCVNEKGVLTQDPVVTESSGDSKVDSGAVKVARQDSGRYGAPKLGGKPQSGCFRFAINFGLQE